MAKNLPDRYGLHRSWRDNRAAIRQAERADVRRWPHPAPDMCCAERLIMSRHLALLLCALLPAACVPPAPPVLATSCGAEGLQSLVGRPASVLQTMRFGTTTRIIRPGMAVTMDFAPDRLNIEINAAETISRVSCG
jgi:hypothetical protein